MISPSDQCLKCECPKNESDEGHIFVTCPFAQQYLLQARARGKELLDAHIAKEAVTDVDWIARHRALIPSLFEDGPEWHDGKCCYWSGDMPALFAYSSGSEPLYTRLAALCMTVSREIWQEHDKVWREWKRTQPAEVKEALEEDEGDETDRGDSEDEDTEDEEQWGNGSGSLVRLTGGED